MSRCCHKAQDSKSKYAVYESAQFFKIFNKKQFSDIPSVNSVIILHLLMRQHVHIA